MQMSLGSRNKGTSPGKACTTEIYPRKANVSKSVSTMKSGKIYLRIKNAPGQRILNWVLWNLQGSLKVLIWFRAWSKEKSLQMIGESFKNYLKLYFQRTGKGYFKLTGISLPRIRTLRGTCVALRVTVGLLISARVLMSRVVSPSLCMKPT